MKLDSLFTPMAFFATVFGPNSANAGNARNLRANEERKLTTSHYSEDFENIETTKFPFNKNAFDTTGSNTLIKQRQKIGPGKDNTGGLRLRLTEGSSSGEISGAWVIPFSMSTSANSVLVSFDYRADFDDFNEYETGKVLLEIDDTLHEVEVYNNMGTNDATGKQATVDIGALAQGAHVIQLGGYLKFVSSMVSQEQGQVIEPERFEIKFDNLNVDEEVPP